MDTEILKYLPGDLISETLRAKNSEQLFDDFEYLWCLMSVDAELQRENRYPWAPFGSFIWRRRDSLGDSEGSGLIGEARRARNDWPALRDGLFAGEKARLDKALETATPLLIEISRKMH